VKNSRRKTTDPYHPAVGYYLQDIADRLDCDVRGDPKTEINSVCTLDQGKPGAITFLANPKYRRYLKNTQAAAVILRQEDAADCPVPALVHDNPYACYAKITQLLYPSDNSSHAVHESAVIADTASLGDNVNVGPFSCIEAGAVIGNNTYIGPGCTVSANTIMGDNCYLHSNVTLYHDCVIGNRVRCHAGVVIGADGFGIAQENGIWVKVNQVGRVVIGDDVEIGANTSIDRGAIEDTVIEEGVKLDNLIQIGHNVHIGAHTAMAGCSGVAGSTVIGRRCTIGARGSILGHLSLADDVHITACSMVTKSIEEPGVYSSGTPLQSNTQWRRNFTRFAQLDDIAKRLGKVEKKLKE
jgi:UDP-3-O-[3-hydroxymyristoyl] glucosamine N-acyltransferase